MRAVSAVRVHYYLSARNAGISRGTAEHEPSRGIYVKLCAFVHHIRGYHRVYDFALYVHAQILHRRAFVVLGGYNHRVYPAGLAVRISHGDLRLAVRAQVGQNALLAHISEPLRELVGQRYGKRHKFGGFGAGITEHHTLIARARLAVFIRFPLLFFKGRIHAHGYVRGLLFYIANNLYVFRVKAQLRAVISYVRYNAARNCGQIYAAPARYFAEHIQMLALAAHFQSHSA